MTTTACHTRHAGECDTELRAQSVLSTLMQHNVEAYIGRTGLVWAFEEATQMTPDGPVDASAWVLVPMTAHGLAAWLGY